MRRARLVPLFFVLACLGVAAQEPITPRVLGELETACPEDASFRALQNALSQADGRRLALDARKVNAVDPHVSHRLADERVADQKASGRCWMFSALNLFRRAAQQKLACEDFEFSQNYLFFFDKLEKANLVLDAFVQTRDLPVTDRKVEWLMQNPTQDGGNWAGFVELVKKYGVVPKEVMPETFASSNSGAVNHALEQRLKVAAMRIRAARTPAETAAVRLQALKDVYRILALNLGAPPKTFTWRYATKDRKVTPTRTYTPRQFYQEVVGEVLDDYLALYSIPTLAFHRKYEIEWDKAVADRPAMFFVNCPLETLKDLARTCLLDNQPVWFGADVGRDFLKDEGLMLARVRDYASLYGMDFRLSRKELFETYSSSPNHNMVFTGVDLQDGKPAKWLVENSWGEKAGRKGYFLMADDWFDHYVQVVVVHRKYIPRPVLEVFGTKAEVLPPWDPMMKALGYR